MKSSEKPYNNLRIVGKGIFWAGIFLFLASWYFIGFASNVAFSPDMDAATVATNTATSGVIFLFICGIVGLVACAAIFYFIIKRD